MNRAKEEVQSLLSRLPDDCSLEDIQYHLYVIEKVRNGLKAAESQGTVSQQQVEQLFMERYGVSFDKDNRVSGKSRSVSP